MINGIVASVLKEAVDEAENIIQILLTILSSYTTTPLNLRILAPSGEGKTWQVKKTAQYFPSENIWEIQQASATALRYFAKEEVIEVDGEFELLSEHASASYATLEDLEASKKERDVAAAEIKKLQKESYKLLDFTNKTLIFLDSQNTQLWDNLKQTLSHDSKIRKDWTTNKINGANSLQKVVYKGYPAVIYCSAKDEINTDETGEINNRFNTISIKGSYDKYKKMQRIVLHEQGAFYEKYVISNKEKEETKLVTKRLIESLDQYQGVFNPYEEFILEHFPATTGNQSRDLRTLSQNMNLLALARAEDRISLVKDDQNLVMVSVKDLHDANNFTKKPLPIPLTKIQYFNNTIKDAINKGASDLVFKPIRYRELMLRLKRVLKERQLSIDRAKMLKTLEKLAITDGLTRLYNLRHFYKQLELEIDRCNRYGHSLALLLLDIDYFKKCNDTYGHLEGDKVLVKLGQAIKLCLRTMDSAYRYGGEEFTIILPETTGKEAKNVAERINASVESERFSTEAGEDFSITISIGVTEYFKEEQLSTFIHRADQAMYKSKAKGRNRISFLASEKA